MLVVVQVASNVTGGCSCGDEERWRGWGWRELYFPLTGREMLNRMLSHRKEAAGRDRKWGTAGVVAKRTMTEGMNVGAEMVLWRTKAEKQFAEEGIGIAGDV